MIYMLRQLMSASTRNEYYIKHNILIILCLLIFNKFIDMMGINWTNYPRISWLTYIAESIIVITCCCQIWLHSEHQIVPLFRLNSPLFEGAFEVGPLTRGIGKLSMYVYYYVKRLATEKKAASTVTAKPLPQQQQQPAQPTKAPMSQPPPPFMFQSTPWVGPIADSPAEAARAVFGASTTTTTGAIQQDMRDLAYVPVPERLGDPSMRINLPKLELRPCHVERKKTTERLNKLLWRLNPQQPVIERFKQEQEDDMLENWDRFDDRSSKVYYDRLRQWLIKNIMDPTLRTVTMVEQQLPQQGVSFVDCPANILAFLMIEPSNVTDNTFPIVLVQKLISVKGYENDRARKHVLERMKEFVKKPRYHSITREPELPSDSDIILHLFNTYLGFAMPNVVPPLVPLQGGDIYKFLLVYFYTTEELEKEVFQ